MAGNPFANLKPPKASKKVIQALTPAEIDRLFGTCSKKSALDIRNQAILCFLDTGLRVSELSSLNVSDLTAGDGTILVRHGKDGKQRVVRIGSRTQKSLWRYLHSCRRGNRLSTCHFKPGNIMDNCWAAKKYLSCLWRILGLQTHLCLGAECQTS